MPEKKFWEAEKDPHRHVFEVIRRLDSEIRSREMAWRRLMSVFLNRTITGLRPGDHGVPDRDEVSIKNVLGDRKLALNPIENSLTTLGARIASQRPMAKILTDTDGPNGYEQRLKALGLEKLIMAEWERQRFHRKTVKVFYHGGVCGFGATHVYPGEKHVEYEIAAPWEFVVDEQAALDGETRVLMRQKWVPLERAIARFANDSLPSKFREENQKALEGAVQGKSTIRAGVKLTQDMVHVVEAFHLPSGWGAEDGRRVVCCEERTLSHPDEWDWPWEFFPFAIFQWMSPVIGWYPQGLVEQQEPVQKQLNRLLGRIQTAMHLYATANTYYEDGSINEKHLKNTSGNLIPYKKGSKPPAVQMPSPISSQAFQFVEELSSWVMRGTGVSEMASHGTVPSRIESGRGLMVLRDRDTGRHALVNMALDDYHIDAAELTIWAARQIDGFSTNYRDGDSLRRINLADVDLPRDSYETSITPSSLLPHEPSGRMAEVENMQRAGWVDKSQALGLLRMPDLEQYRSLELAARDSIERQISDILTKGVYRKPEPYQDLLLGLQLFTNALLRAEVQGAPEERLEQMKDWIEAADAILVEKMPTPPPAPPTGMDMGMGGVMGGPQMPPGMPPPMPPGMPPGPM